MMRALRAFLKSGDWTAWEQLETDQRRGVLPPPLEQPTPPGAARIDLVPPDHFTVGAMPLIEAIRQRRSRRKYTDAALTLEELSFLLWATQGVEKIVGDGRASLRTVPSAGARHPFETYLLVNRVETLAPGLYRYLPLEHQLYLHKAEEGLAAAIDAACFGQYVLNSAVTFLWTAVPGRTEWRYATLAHRVILMDAGHLGQNLYLACEAIAAGTCTIGAFDQERLDALLGVDGEDEFTIRPTGVAPVGRIA
ncbi:MAG: SagB/ThcOx family dehydrogenase [Chloroflexi bacterium]|nr:SagB/ThcOx family dehydrogenase [Chloroflexota bacterium]